MLVSARKSPPDGVSPWVIRMKGAGNLVEGCVHGWRRRHQRTNVGAHSGHYYLMVMSYDDVLLAVRETMEIPRRSL